MSTAARRLYSIEEYLALERAAPTRSEYYQGEIFSMAGGTHNHALICVNLQRVLGNQLVDRPCQVLGSDMRVHVNLADLLCYPDVLVYCGEPKFRDNKRDTLTNPVVVIEVLSPSTERTDRGRKFLGYQKLESLQQYLLVAQDRYLVECYTKQPDGTWLYSIAAESTSVVQLTSIDCTLPLTEVYSKVIFPPRIVDEPIEIIEE